MAGYIVTLNNEQALRECIETGIYSTNLSSPNNGKWRVHHEGTFADYFGMEEGDNIYFFIKRKIYGIGELINHNGDCKFWNYIGAEKPIDYIYEDVKGSMILKGEENLNNRCFCLFKAYPNFFKQGIDMDDVLSSNPTKFKMLRAFWKLSFVKIDEDENKALRDIILKRNEEHIFKNNDCSFEYNENLQKKIIENVNENYIMKSNSLLESCSNGNHIGHEMAIEAAMIDLLTNDKSSIFGNWDYISHQVIASPFKPIDYMDKMDVFGFRNIKGFDTVSKYLIIELKKDKAEKEVIDQVMKYVDWVNEEYAYGDYGMIEAFVVAYDFSKEVIDYRNEICKRNYTKGRRPTVAAEWKSVKLIQYRYNDGRLNFYEVE